MKMKVLYMQVGRIKKVIMIWNYMYGIYKTSLNDKFQFVLMYKSNEEFMYK